MRTEKVEFFETLKQSCSEERRKSVSTGRMEYSEENSTLSTCKGTIFSHPKVFSRFWKKIPIGQKSFRKKTELFRRLHFVSTFKTETFEFLYAFQKFSTFFVIVFIFLGN